MIMVRAQNLRHQIQGIWRHDIKHTRVGGERKYSQYYGGTGGSPFYDRPPLGFSDSTYISSIRVRCGAFVDGIQASACPSKRDPSYELIIYFPSSLMPIRKVIVWSSRRDRIMVEVGE